MSRTQIFEWHKHFKNGHEKVEDTPSQEDLPHRKLMITSWEWCSWCGMIADWQCEWLEKNSASTGNQCKKLWF